jgi:two-component system, sensor histidine kinase and response regulator
MKELNECLVMVVDDISTNVDILVETLGDEYDVSVAMDGESALELVEENPPDLILMDIMMPGLNGYEVCRRLKQDIRFQDIPVIFVTGKSEVADERLGFEVGAVDYITKPISPPIVKARVRTHLTLRQARNTLEGQNRRLIESARLKEDVDHIMRHDLKGPLTNILARPQLMMLDKELKAEHVKSLESIRASGLRMLNMINVSLDLFKMERGAYVSDSRPVDLIELVRKLGTEWQGPAESRQVGLRLLMDGKSIDEGSVRRALAEELLCYSMLSNLVKNAVEASPKNGMVTLDITVDVPGIDIHNQGAVAPEIRDSFFEKFTTGGKSSGMGLGTYSAKLMAETMGGSIAMTTSDEEGTTVMVRLRPVAEEAGSSAGQAKVV